MPGLCDFPGVGFWSGQPGLVLPPSGIGTTGGLQFGGSLPLVAATGGSPAVASAVVDISFPLNQAFLAGTGTTPITNLLSCTRASSGYYLNAAGQLINFPNSNTLRYGTNGLLVEESRTNLVLQSQAFNNASWTQSALTETDNATIAPDGTTTAGKLTENTATGVHQILSAPITKAASALAYAASIYFKQNNRRVVISMQDASSNGMFAVFDLVGGQVGVAATAFGTTPFTAGSASIQALANGWLRCTVIATSNTNTSIAIAYNLDNATGTQALSQSYTGDGASGVFIWGAQLEQNAFALSYIPTTAASATRAADVITYSQALSVFTPAQGTFYFNVAAMPAVFAGNQAIVSDSTLHSFLVAQSGNNWQTGDQNTAFVASSGQSVLNASKIAAAYTGVSELISVNGAGVGTGNAGTAPVQYASLHIGQNTADSTVIDTYIRRLAFFNVQLQNANLNTLSQTGP